MVKGIVRDRNIHQLHEDIYNQNLSFSLPYTCPLAVIVPAEILLKLSLTVTQILRTSLSNFFLPLTNNP